jgi:formylglycine-generating enzyme required for sulfatase activity
MPLIEADDPAAVDGKIHSHRFIGANFAHARSAGFEEQERLTMAMLKGAVTLSVELAVDQPRAQHATIEVRVKNTGTGHRFPSGTTDISEAWLEVVAGSQALPTFASGLLDSDHYLDPKAHSWRTVYVDKYNLPVDLHNLAAVHDTPLDNYIEPGKTDVAKFEIPLSGTETISVRIRLRLRKANQRWTDWLTNFEGRTEPIADIHEKTLSIDPGKLKWSTPALPPEKKTPESALPQIPSMVLVPAGQAILGSDRGDSDEAPMHKVDIEAFYMDRMPVTNSQYRRYLRATQKRGPAHKIGWAEKYNWKGRKYPPGSADQPAILISWEEARAYCTWRGKRLPREAEWEKAARGPNGFTYPWGNRWEDGACAILDGVEVPPRVGMCPNRASPYGVLDMVGGVYEWTADQYMAYSRSSLHRNANEWITVFGGYAFALRGVPSGQIGPATTASSRSGHADNMRARIGFRCAQDGRERRPE